MILRSLQLNNFRQFYGTSPIVHFAAEREVNVSVIHGMNGAGKTALLNAFTWTLFGSATRGFQNEELVVNFRAIDEGSEGERVEAWVELEFEHQENRYRVRREATTVRGPDSDPYRESKIGAPQLKWCGPEGQWTDEEGVRDVIDRILPPDLHTYFFFDGERIERIVDPSKEEQKRLATATKKFLGIELLDYAERDLKRGLKILEAELKESSGAELRDILERIAKLEHDQEDLEDEIKVADDNLEGYRENKAVVEAQLRNIEAVRHLQEERDRLKGRELEIQEAILESKRSQSAALSTNGGFLVLTWPSERFESVIEGMRTRRELPSGIKDTFVADLLQDERCICERALEKGSPARQAVETWLQRAGRSDVEDRATRDQGTVQGLKSRIDGVWSSILREGDHQREWRTETATISRRLAELSDMLKNAPHEDVVQLENRRSELEELIETEIRKQVRMRDRHEANRKQFDELRQERKRQQGAQAAAQLAHRRVQCTEEAIARVARWRTHIEDEFRADLEGIIDETFDLLSHTPYHPHLDKSFRLRLVNALGDGRSVTVAASQGENQALSLSFLAGIIEFTRRLDADRSHLPTSSDSKYPLVMDSPFGALDPHYRRTIAEHIPSVADQVVALVTPTQWRGEVAETVSDRVGRHYLLVYHTPKDAESDHDVVINGRRQSLIEQSHDGSEYTEIREVSDG